MDIDLAKRKIRAAIEFRKALTPESDRGCALYGAAYLENALQGLIAANLVDQDRRDEDIFKGTAPLSTFSSRIAMAFFLGKISISCRRDLDRIRRIRNDFAHSSESMSFEDGPISDRCRSLVYSYHDGGGGARAHFTAAVFALLAEIDTATLRSRPPTVPQDRPPGEAQKEAARVRLKEMEAAFVREGIPKEKMLDKMLESAETKLESFRALLEREEDNP